MDIESEYEVEELRLNSIQVDCIYLRAIMIRKGVNLHILSPRCGLNSGAGLVTMVGKL